MSELEARIVKLDPMRVASVRAVSETPEVDAWSKLREWARPKGFLQDDENHPIFGFNNPNPQPDQKEYGYEFWIKVDSDVESEGEVQVKDRRSQRTEYSRNMESSVGMGQSQQI